MDNWDILESYHEKVTQSKMSYDLVGNHITIINKSKINTMFTKGKAMNARLRMICICDARCKCTKMWSSTKDIKPHRGII